MFSNQLKVMHAIDDDRADIYAQTFFFFSKAMLFFFFLMQHPVVLMVLAQ